MNLLNEFDQLGTWAENLKDVRLLLPSIEEKVIAKTPESGDILPVPELVFNAFKHSNYDDISVCIVGQDPYHQRPEIDGKAINQAMGLAFSVPKAVKTPPSLKNIYKELAANIVDWEAPDHGDLSHWTNRVLLLNTALTVEYDKAGAHSKTGWGNFTNKVIEKLVKRERPIVFLSWGKHAHKVTAIAENTHHKVIRTSHPSPLGARKEGVDFVSFLGSGCFSQANEFLKLNGISPINW
ncbi:uracil-DNA glycosylase [Vibrio crassostreae]|uniref:uracil-DNA glycosylase n=1 Tax=Vibrio crassostreae TaxID=246167 RepID=UPI001B30791D|nr:uracil-DNA glycosylase [Vibrio crassostreae]